MAKKSLATSRVTHGAAPGERPEAAGGGAGSAAGAGDLYLGVASSVNPKSTWVQTPTFSSWEMRRTAKKSMDICRNVGVFVVILLSTKGTFEQVRNGFLGKGVLHFNGS